MTGQATEKRTRAATEARVARSHFKREIKQGTFSLNMAMAHPLAQRMTIVRLLGAFPYRDTPERGTKGLVYHAARAAERVCEMAGVRPSKRVDDLTSVERVDLAVAYTDYHRTDR